MQQYEAANEAELEEKSWIRDFLSYLNVRVEDLITAQEKLLELTQEPDGPYMYEASIADDLRQLENLRKCEHFLSGRQPFLPLILKISEDLENTKAVWQKRRGNVRAQADEGSD